MAHSHFLVLTATTITLLLMATTTPIAQGQVTTACTPSMISNFTPCMNFITNSSSNGTTSPTSDCCSSLKTLTSSGLGCLCLIVTGNVPFQAPINRTLAISLPRACNMPGVPVQCKATAAPIPAPGPAALGPTVSPPASSPTSPKVGSPDPQPGTPAQAPEAGSTPLLTPPSPTVSSVTPTTTTGSSSSVNPSSAGRPSSGFSPALLLFALASALLKYY